MMPKKMRWLVTMAFAAVILVLSAVGGNWKIGLAETIPTIPVVESIQYQKPVFAGRSALEITFTGNSYIDPTYTKVRWQGPNGAILLLTPTYMSADKTMVKVLVPQSALLKPGTAKVSVVNHPGAGTVEVSQIYNVQILVRVFLPAVSK